MFFISFISTIISLSSPLSFTAKQVLLLFSFFSLYFSPLFFPYFPLHSPCISFIVIENILGAFFYFSIIVIRPSKKSTLLDYVLNEGLSLFTYIQAAFLLSLSCSEIMFKVMPSLFRLFIRTLYLSLFLSCLVIPNKSRKSKVTSFLYSFP